MTSGKKAGQESSKWGRTEEAGTEGLKKHKTDQELQSCPSQQRRKKITNSLIGKHREGNVTQGVGLLGRRDIG